MPEFTYRTVPAALPVTPQMRAWQDAVRLGFGLADGPDEAYDHWAQDVAADGLRMDAVYATPPKLAPVAEVDLPVATFGTLTQTINVGAGRLEPAQFITDVTVRTTHRRRGLLKRLMLEALDRARIEGLSLATLTASEGSIYGRYGFGISTEYRSVALATGPKLGWLREQEPRVAMIPTADSHAIRAQVFERFHAATRGSHGRINSYRPMLTGAWDYDKDTSHRDLRVVVHWDPDGRADGVVTYQFNEPDQSVKVWDLLAATPEAELGLWRFLGAIDLVEKVTWRHGNPNSPLRWALSDPRAVSVTKLEDYIWLRILDVPRALEARGWDADGEAEFEVVDPLGHAAGVWRVGVRDGQGEVSRAGGSASAVQVEARALASLYLGLADARRLAEGGQISGPADEVARLARLFRTADAPYNLAAF